MQVVVLCVVLFSSLPLLMAQQYKVVYKRKYIRLMARTSLRVRLMARTSLRVRLMARTSLRVRLMART